MAKKVRVDTCPDKLGVPIKENDKVVYTMSEKSATLYTGTVLYINSVTYNILRPTYEVSIFTDKTKREIIRNSQQIVGVQEIINNHPEYFI